MIPFLATDTGDPDVLVLLDLTAVFDTVDYNVLISRLQQWVGIQGGLDPIFLRDHSAYVLAMFSLTLPILCVGFLRGQLSSLCYFSFTPPWQHP